MAYVILGRVVEFKRRGDPVIAIEECVGGCASTATDRVELAANETIEPIEGVAHKLGG